MVVITNSQEWLNDLGDCNIEDIHNLYESIIGVTEIGGFTCFQKNDVFYLKTDDHKKVLILLDGKSVKAFLDKLDHDYGGKFGWVGGNYDHFRNRHKKK